ncbi:GNAT family N-acetyltransferase [Hyalangium rubrum]|uniref:GNAT family N-acetyltransferase n=1 Tax=Hyalangium rubrum TaxID=3103134 RepID=A0ABU5GWU6_9BACT|nr:GNAT family N-acetyltransferase [Hyalangium sp. s54d21]MDY7225666.1 GNAT family N-acetyltransferase [Hyalangium sp. s54d21]
MSRAMPELRTERLLIRPFVREDLDAVFRLFDVELADANMGNEGPQRREGRKAWLEWTLLGYDQQAHLLQPPYGDRAIVLADTGAFVGACGLVACLDEFDRIPGLRPAGTLPTGRASAEVGLDYAISPAHQGRGYASEAAQALVDYALGELRLTRIIATTSRDNAASIGVMRNLGMRIEENPFPEPPWLQVVGWLAAPG